MKRLSILLLCVSMAHAESAQTCELVDDTSEILMQLRQSALSLDDIDLNPEALSEQEVQLLKAMIADAKLVPIYQIPYTLHILILMYHPFLFVPYQSFLFLTHH